MLKRIKITAVAFIVISLLASIYLNYFRFQAEQAYKTVQIMIDYDELYSLAISNGISLEELASRFSDAGVSGVVARERTISELQLSGDIVLLKSSEAALLGDYDSELFTGLSDSKQSTYIITKNKAVYETLYNELKAVNKDISFSQDGEYFAISAVLTEKEIEKMGVGFIYKDLQAISDGGLTVIPRLREYAKSSEQSIDNMAEVLKKIPGPAIITFNDPAIPGTSNIPYLAQKLKEQKVSIGMFEFYNQSGFNSLARQLDKNVIRVHSISETDMLKYNEKQAVERYRLAVAERNIRAVYVRFFGLEQSATALDRAINYIGDIKAGIQGEGFVILSKNISSIGESMALVSIPYSRAVVFLVGLGVIGAGVLALGFFLKRELWISVLGALAVFGWAGLLFVEPMLARKSFALLSVIIYPGISVIYIMREERRSLTEAILALLKMSAISFIGAVIMTGLLADKSFMLTLDIFSGVKIAHVLPLIIIAAYFVLKGTNLLTRIRNILDYPVQNKHVLVGLIVLGALAVYIIRTGNQAPQLVSSWETTLREMLDRVLGVRPRTKEFLFGHPAMLVLLYYGYDMRKIGLLLLAVIGQVSLVNTYAHIHTPLVVSLIRTLHGLWIGVIIGIAAIICLNCIIKWLQTKGALDIE